MDEGEYELVSHDEVEKLKKEIERLKSNPFIQNSSDDKLYESIRNLNDSVNKLYSLFENINRQLVKEYTSGDSPEEKIDRLLEQNKSIAEALVAFGSKIESFNKNNVQKTQKEDSSYQTEFNDAFVPRPQTQPQNQMQYGQQPIRQTEQNLGLPPLQPPQIGSSLPQMQTQQPKSQFVSTVDPGYPVPDRFQGLNMPPSMGSPLDVQPQRKKGLFNLRK